MNIKFFLRGALICAVAIGVPSYFFEIYFIDEMIANGIETNKKEFWGYALKTYGMIIVPVIFLGIITSSPERAIRTEMVFKSIRIATIKLMIFACYLCIGLIAWHIYLNVI